jgi:pyruvate dehydrogenase E1 component
VLTSNYNASEEMVRRHNNSEKSSQIIHDIERKILWLACWMIDQANRREKIDGVKAGGHQASSASMTSIMTALYFNVLKPEDRVAVKPHASPVFHAIQYLMGNQSREKLEKFRGYGGAQSYPSRTKDTDDVDFPLAQSGLGSRSRPSPPLCRTIFAQRDGKKTTWEKAG